MKTKRLPMAPVFGLLLTGLWAALAAAQPPDIAPPASPVESEGSSYGPDLPDDVVVQYDPETGSLIVITDEETNSRIQTVIEALDQPVPQVLINVLFLEVTHSNGIDLGAEFSASDTDTRTGYTLGSNNGAATVTQTTETTRQDVVETLFDIAGESTGGFYRLIKDDLNVTLRALAENSKLEVLSRPSILTRNNQQATITVGQEVPFIRNTRILQDGQQLNTVEYEDIGIILQVTPHIRPDGLVDMDVLPEISTLTGETVPIAAGVFAPVFAKRSAETGVVVPTGQTVVIGGLMEDQETVSERKVPLLGDIPVLGRAFKRKITSKSKTELLIFLTPYIIPNASQLNNMTAMERGRARLAPKVFEESDVRRYTDPTLVPADEFAGMEPAAPAPETARDVEPVAPRAKAKPRIIRKR